jgi:hypothetical protein
MTMRKRAGWRALAAGMASLVPGLAVWAGSAWAQTPTVAKDQKKVHYTNKTTFFLPVKIDDRTRGNLREVCLYVKRGEADWVRQETAPPTQSTFTYRVPQDGEYWFSVVTIDRAGKSTPADVAKEAPGIRVVVDTQAPVVDVDAEGDLLRCSVHDVHPDYTTLRLTFQDEQGERPLEAVPNKTGYFRSPGPAVHRGKLRVTAIDRCGNSATREVSLRNSPGPAPQVPPIGLTPAMRPEVSPAAGLKTSPQGSGPLHTAGFRPEPPVAPPPVILPPAAQKTESTVVIPDPGITRVDVPNFVPSPAPVINTLPPSAPSPSPTGPVMASGVSLPPALPPTPDTTPKQTISPAASSLPANASSANAPANRQLLNTTQAVVDYRIDQVGPSGVGKVEVYLTSDNGNTWQRVREDADRRSPAEIDLPGEGVFGIRLVVTNGNGFGGSIPRAGDQPTSWIEVDSTAPAVQLRDIEPLTLGGSLEVRWNASDRNLASEPVTLYYRAGRDGPWQVIARNVKNDGLYKWAFPRDQGSHFFVKIEVSDQAGNVARAETANAVALDMTVPQAQVVGISGAGQRPTPGGN